MKLRIVTLIFCYLAFCFGNKEKTARNVNIQQQGSGSPDSQIIYIDPPPHQAPPPSTPAHGYFKCDCPPGLPGPRGLQGPNGIIGMEGMPGDRGKPGQNGKDGKTGPQGPQGLKGVKGDVGQQGIKGDKGPTGSMGLPGIQGNQGVIGPTGQTGPTGTPGQPGVNGLPGAQGPPGIDGLNWWQQPLSPFRDENLVADVTKNLKQKDFIYVGGGDDDNDDDDDNVAVGNINNNYNNHHDFEASRSVISKTKPNRSYRKQLRSDTQNNKSQKQVLRRRKYQSSKRTSYLTK